MYQTLVGICMHIFIYFTLNKQMQKESEHVSPDTKALPMRGSRAANTKTTL